MENRFTGSLFPAPTVAGRLHGLPATFVQPFSARDRVLVVLIENGGVDLGIPALVDKLLSAVPLAETVIPADLRRKLVAPLGEEIRKLTDNLIETAELALNRYTASKPEFFGDVVVLRDGTSSHQDLKNTLLSLSRERRIIDLVILTHGSGDFISVPGGVDGARIRAMRAAHGKPLTIRSVYMMNCVGSSLNQAWIDAGARVSAGALLNNYLPEPTTFFFWNAWKAGQTFENAVTSAYRRTVNLLNGIVRQLVPVPLNFETFDFVKDSAPVIQGQRTLTIGSDDLSFARSLSSDLATTVLPVGILRSLAASTAEAGRALSQQGIEFIKSWEPSAGGATPSLLQRIDECQRAVRDGVTVPLTQNQNDALVSFVCGVGAERFKASTLLRLLNGGDYGAVSGELKQWTKARRNGSVTEVPSLAARRKAEAELFQGAAPTMAQSLSALRPTHTYAFHSPGTYVTEQTDYSVAMNPVVAGIALGDALQIGLAGVAVLQTQVAASQGSFSLTFDKAQRLLTSEARAKMPGSQSAKQSYSRHLLHLGIDRAGTAKADVIIEWEGNAYGEIGTPMIRRNLGTSTEWSKSSANITISRREVIPTQADPRTWPIVYAYDGTYDPLGNGYFEFHGEFELNAFGGLKFSKHEVVSRSFADWALAGSPEGKVRRSADAIVRVPAVPQEQLDYLKTKLP